MALEKLVIQKLEGMDLHGVKVVELVCDGNALTFTFEINEIKVDVAAVSEHVFEVKAVTYQACVYKDATARHRCNDWARYMCAIVFPLVASCRKELTPLQPTPLPAMNDVHELEVKPLSVHEDEASLEADSEAEPKDVATLLEAVRQELALVRKENEKLQGAQTDMTSKVETPISTKKKMLRIAGNLMFYLTLFVVVLGVALFGLQEPGAPPRNLFGYSAMTVLSRSMEPTLPVRSLVLIERVDSGDTLEVGDIVTYLRPNNTTVTHRIIEIVEDYQGSGERGFRLQGDNNATPDQQIIPAVNVIGVVIYSNYTMGQVITFIQNHIILILIGLVFLVALSFVAKKFILDPLKAQPELVQPIKVDDQDVGIEDDHLVEGIKKKAKGSGVTVGITILVVFLALFGYSIFRVMRYRATYRAIEQMGADLRMAYTQTLVDQEDERSFLVVDWESLLERNADVVAWVHVPGTAINYPVLAGYSNEEYLSIDIDREFSIAGSIFLEENNGENFMDVHSIIYGHHMGNGSKFADLVAFVNGEIRVLDAPYIHLYLPDGTMSVYAIVAAQATDIWSEIYHLPVVDLDALFELMLEDNVLSEVAFDGDFAEIERVLTLSTCTEAGASPLRSIVFGVLVEELVVPHN